MEKVVLGKSNIEVSRLCFGGLTVGPLQANLTPEIGGEIIAYAIDRGVNFIDTAQLYRTYPHIRRALAITRKFDTVIASKTYAYDQNGAIAAVEEARRALDRDYIDIFLLHEQESAHTLAGHRAALDYLLACRARGIIRAVGISTHHVAGVRAAIELDEIDVIHPMINSRGLGIVDGSARDMLAAIRGAHEKKIGIYAMKALGGGNLINDVHSALDFVLEQPHIHSIALGMQSIAEVGWNIAKFEGKSAEQLPVEARKLHIEEWCSACGDCVSACGQAALRIAGDKLVVDAGKCVLCGYCGAKCEDFCIKIL
ncbi:MAG: aldo/keto reductase [Oscillospiraceae bacterium]|nr:aldo/keto reductase [Oscillospiraceae bacterium]